MCEIRSSKRLGCKACEKETSILAPWCRIRRCRSGWGDTGGSGRVGGSGDNIGTSGLEEDEGSIAELEKMSTWRWRRSPTECIPGAGRVQ